MTCGSLFAGIGGFDLGFERAGIKTVWQVEINEYCRRVLARHFPDAERFGDIRECGVHNLKPVDIICGGDPCQRNSNAWRHGSGAESPAPEFLRIIAELRPRIVVRENPRALRADAPWPWWRFRNGLEQLGYAVLPFRFRACCLGLDHRRERMFLLAGLPDSYGPGLEGHECKVMAGTQGWRYHSDPGRPDRRRPASRICGRADGISHRVDDRLKCLGNAVVPQIAEWIGRRIVEAALYG